MKFQAFFVFLICLKFLSACADQARTSNIKLKTNALNSISAFSDFECFGVNITGDNIASKLESLNASDILPKLLSDESVCSYPGVFQVVNSTLSSSSSLDFSLSVPMGSSRVIQVFGVDDVEDSVDCSTLTAADLFDESESDRYQVYELEIQIQDLLSADDLSLDLNFADFISTDRMDCSDLTTTTSPSAPSLEGIFQVCVSDTSHFLSYSIVDPGMSQLFSLDVTGATAKVTVQSFQGQTDCSGSYNYKIEYNFDNFSPLNYISSDTSGRDLFELDFFVSTVFLTPTSSSLPVWESASVCNHSLTNNNPNDVTGDCGVFPASAAALADIVASTGSSLYFGTLGPLGINGSSGRPSTLKEVEYVLQ